MKLSVKLLAASVAACAFLAGCSSVDLGNGQGAVRYTEADFTNPASPLSQSSIYFDFDSYAVPTESQEMIEAHASYISTHPNAKVELQGNTDERGGREYNLALGQRRSDAVKSRLQLLGVPGDRLESISFGKEKPRALGKDEASYQENRRVDIVYKSK